MEQAQETMKSMIDCCGMDQMECPCGSMIKDHKVAFGLTFGLAVLLFVAANTALVLGVVAFFRTF
jgi:hypothetical protein